mgnify:CR=1 FL=1
MEIAQEVENLCQLRGVNGFIDCTHVRISSTIKGDRDFYNRKGYPFDASSSLFAIHFFYIVMVWSLPVLSLR